MTIQRIQSAVYGNGNTCVDVQASVKDLVGLGTLYFTISPETFGIPDPCPGVIKQFGVVYTNSSGGTLAASGRDGAAIFLIP